MKPEKLLRVIVEAKKARRSALNLARKRITELPPEIGELNNLVELD